MIPDTLVTSIYLAAAMLFILSLGGLSRQDTARRGNLYGIVGMTIAIGATVLSLHGTITPWVWGPMAVGAVIGVILAVRVAMTAMPELVAMLHSFVGLAAVLVGIASALAPEHGATVVDQTIHRIEIYAGVAIGAITFTGSIIAWAKLRGSVSGRPLLLPGRHVLNGALLLATIGLGVVYVRAPELTGLPPLLIMTVITLFLGWHLVMAIGGADMPVVVSLLNSYSGWAAAAAGFMLSNDLLIVTGALVGSSGAILSVIMCRAMNRSIWNVVFGGFGTNAGATPAGSAVEGDVVPVDVDGVAALCRDAKSVVIVPGYGMAVAQAQHPVRELTDLLRESGKVVRYAIHPVAGRLPGHMNVLLAEAGIPYDIVLEMDEINDDMPETDVVLVIGANDIVNPGALDDPSSPIYGMPVIQAWEAGVVVVLKRGMAAGYAGVDNPLFVRENTRMYFGDAKKSIVDLVAALRQ